MKLKNLDDYFRPLRAQLMIDAQIKIAYHWRRFVRFRRSIDAANLLKKKKKLTVGNKHHINKGHSTIQKRNFSFELGQRTTNGSQRTAII